jgi:hypothetical protein
MMKKELEELIGILCYKGWGFRMRKRFESDNKYVINVVLGSEELECEVDDEKGLKALAFDVVNFNRNEYEVCDITGQLGILFFNCVRTRHDIEVNDADDFENKYNFRNLDAKWIIEIEVDGVVYMVPYDNEELIKAINVKLTPPIAYTEKHNGVEILVESDACGVLVYKLRIGYKFVAFDNLDSAKKFIENNVKGE